MRKLLHRYRRHIDRASQGQALAEFALISVVLLMIFGTALDLGRVFYADITIENAARAGALQAARTPSSFTNGGCDYATNAIGCAVINESRGSFVVINGSDIDSGCETMAGTAVACQTKPQPATRSRVTVSTTFDLLTPILSVFFGGQTIDMSATVASDQEALPSPALVTEPPIAPPPSDGSPDPSISPDPSGSPDPSSSPDPSTTPVPTETPNINCDPGDTVAPDLVVGVAGGRETVAQARDEWYIGAGFKGTLHPTNAAYDAKLVTAQWANASKTVLLAAGACYSLNQQVWLDYLP